MTSPVQLAARAGVARYRKLPVVSDAVRWGPEVTRERAYDIYRWVVGCIGATHPPCDDEVSDTPWVGVAIDPADGLPIIRTLEGDMKVSDGDWIIRGVQGELYPCKPDIFDATYEVA